ncbi:MAG TPA: DUF1800 domain-containing protein [Candidatus Nanopelagicales bacterium]
MTDCLEPASASRPRGRRWLLNAAGVVAVGAGASLLAPSSAEAATAARIRVVTKYVPLVWRYDPRTRVTTVTKSRKTRVTARFVGAAVSERNAKGVWVRVPYEWRKSRNALVYSRYLYLLLLPKPAPKPVPKPAPAPLPGGPTAIAASARSQSPYVGTSMVWHLARRASYGPSPALLAEITALGPNRWLERQLTPAAIADPLCDAMLAKLGAPGTGMMPVGTAIRLVNAAMRDKTRATPINDWQQRQLAAKAHVIRAAWSNRTLLTVMEDFWGNHFNVPTFGNQVAASREHLATTIRANAFGKFSALLTAVTTHPAMLSNLNNRDSDKSHPNENLGRELLELHTVGVEAPYGEAGVVTSARILTGLSVGSDTEEFLYKDWMHWTGPVNILGFNDANSAANGEAVARRYLSTLAHHPDTARHVCGKLAVRFVSDTPTQTLVDKLAGVYLGNDTAIAPVLRVLFSSAEFAGSAGAKTHRPFERLMATVRITGINPVLTSGDPAFDHLGAVNALYGIANDAGNAPFAWAAPNGYPDVAAAWNSTAATLQSWNNRILTVQGWYPQAKYLAGTGAGLATLLPYKVSPWTFPATYTHGQLVQHVANRLFGVPLPPDHVDAVCAFLNVTPARLLRTYPTEVPGAVSWQLGYWVALLLDSPYGLQR